ncbi:ATP-binding cassette domain-containing protein [Polaribacter undariae]|uniref:ATP-binding cassette domain-containing protein n=1 Tax=Polaribacter sejongensis TaxID=985043 RepID=A0AAJ1QVE0_9FLAO|nr:ATP-binding cassette domain-containing protein [Polaribacter undariae]MDN3618994.1 ATP-binding cassette domain-containing protein [Polaribacter undariae]UWD33082.1 ATP-binding cassette domain-containing protein [Polaribacter undariae]
MENIHFTIENKSLSAKSSLVENILKGTHSFPNLKNKKGLLFSNSILDTFIDEEAKHDTQILTSKENRSIRTLSSGEQKKALLNYLLQQKPDFLILDSPFESLDIASVSNLKEDLIALSSEIILIQLFNRKEEILPIITHVLEIDNDEIIENVPIEKYTFKEINFEFNGEVPKPITFYKNIPNQLISLQNVNVEYDERSILKDINWTINKNEFWHLIGPNGSGKTTILSMIYGNNVKAFRQEVYLFGKKKGSGESVWEIKEKIGYFSPAILELFKRKISISQMVLSGFFDSVGLYQTPTTLQIKIADDWLELLNLKNKRNTSFQDLTTATQRLVLIARAMIKHPPLLILDEPLINLDNQGTAIVVALINKIVKESDTTILFVSHREVENLNPNFIYELTPSKNGSTGKIKENS